MRETECEQCTFLPELEADCSPTSSSDMSQSAPSSGTKGGAAHCEHLQTLGGGLGSRLSTPTCEPSTVADGPEAWIAYMQASLARVGKLPAEALVIQRITGLKSCESPESADQGISSSSPCLESGGNTGAFALTSMPLDTSLPTASSPMLAHWVRRILGNDIGLLATPTKTANQCAPSMQKWPSCRHLTAVAGGTLTPGMYEWMMGWPLGMTALVRQETAKSRSKRLSRGDC